MTDDETCTVEEAAERLGVHPDTVRRLADAGQLDHYRKNPHNPRSHRRIYASAVQAILDARKAAPPSQSA